MKMCRYITAGVPTVLYTYIPLLLHGIYLTYNAGYSGTIKVPLWLGVWLVVTHSFLKHKEFRFIYPLLPLCMGYIGKTIDRPGV